MKMPMCTDMEIYMKSGISSILSLLWPYTATGGKKDNGDSDCASGTVITLLILAWHKVWKLSRKTRSVLPQHSPVLLHV